jgi:hypothetical protein
MALKPPKLKPMFYENAAIYTNALLDAYMDYKNVIVLPPPSEGSFIQSADLSRFTAPLEPNFLISRLAQRNL